MIKIKKLLFSLNIMLIASINTGCSLKNDEHIINNNVSIEFEVDNSCDNNIYNTNNNNTITIAPSPLPSPSPLPDQNKDTHIQEETIDNKIIIEEIKKKKLVALTFDDGPSKYTNDLLLLLDKYNVKATFFVLEYNCKKYPEVIKSIYDYGHEIAIHGATHTSFLDLTLDEINNEIVSTNDYIESLGVECSDIVRPPYGSLNKNIKNNITYPFILWSIDTEDWKTRNKDKIKAEIMDNITTGSIILMHDTNRVFESDYEALDDVLATLTETYQFVTVTELFESNNIELENGKTYSKIKSE